MCNYGCTLAESDAMCNSWLRLCSAHGNASPATSISTSPPTNCGTRSPIGDSSQPWLGDAVDVDLRPGGTGVVDRRRRHPAPHGRHRRARPRLVVRVERRRRARHRTCRSRSTSTDDGGSRLTITETLAASAPPLTAASAGTCARCCCGRARWRPRSCGERPRRSVRGALRPDAPGAVRTAPEATAPTRRRGSPSTPRSPVRRS